MAFNDLVSHATDTCLSEFGESALFQPKAGGSPIPITGITCPAPMEDVAYGVAPDPTAVYFFVGFLEISPRPSIGDTVSYGSATYDIDKVLVDRMGGATLRMKRNA